MTNISIYGYSAVGGRRENEDSIGWTGPEQDSVLAVLADGLGGHGGGSRASRIAVDEIRKQLKGIPLPSSSQFFQAMSSANANICAEQENANTMKTTAVVLAVKGSRAVWCHIGDSRLYHYYNGRLADYTLDHSLCQVQVKAGEITRDQIPGHPDRSKILRVLGASEIRPEVHEEITLRPGFHAFLICSDGVWERLKEPEILFDLQKSETPQAWVNYLRFRGEKREHKDADNNSAIGIFIEISGDDKQ